MILEGQFGAAKMATLCLFQIFDMWMAAWYREVRPLGFRKPVPFCASRGQEPRPFVQ
jgi:hypothetical protein